MAYILKLDLVHEALTAHNGALRPAADALRIPLHTLKSFVDQNAELQAVVANRDIAIIDASREAVFEFMTSDTTYRTKLSCLRRAGVLERAAADVYSAKSQVDVNSKAKFSEMSEQELKDFLAANSGIVHMLKGLCDE